MKILIVKLSSIGDVIHTLPSLKSLREGYKDATIDWLVEEPSASLLENNELIDELIVVKNKGWTKDFFATYEKAKYLQTKKYDLVVDFQGLLKSSLFVFFSKAIRKIGYINYREGSPFFLTKRLVPYAPKVKEEEHALLRYLNLAVASGGKKQGEVKYPIFFNDREKENVERLLKDNGLRENNFYIVNAGTRWDSKKWSNESFREAIEKINNKHNLKAVIIGAKSEEENNGKIISNLENVYNFAGLTSLKELSLLFEKARFSVTVDSGPMHLACASGGKVISLFGATSLFKTGPFGNLDYVVRKDIDCSPCFKKHCPLKGDEYMACMAEIKSKDVMEKVEEVLKERVSA